MRKAIIITVTNPLNGEVILRRRIGRLPRIKSGDTDLGLDNWGRFLASLLLGGPYNASRSVSLKDTSNASRTVNTYQTATTNLMFNNTAYVGLRVTIAVGNNATAPARSDYNLKGTTLGEADVGASYTDGSGVVNVTVSLSFGSAVTIYEIGLFMEMLVATTSPYKYKFMLDRTVITDGIAVDVGQTLNITYQIPI
jgi:hypothetical protein